MVDKEDFSFQPQMDWSIKLDRVIQVYIQRVNVAELTFQLNTNNSFPSITRKKEVESWEKVYSFFIYVRYYHGRFTKNGPKILYLNLRIAAKSFKNAGVYSEPNKTTKMVLFAKTLAVNYFRKKLYPRCSTGFWICLWNVLYS